MSCWLTLDAGLCSRAARAPPACNALHQLTARVLLLPSYTLVPSPRNLDPYSCVTFDVRCEAGVALHRLAGLVVRCHLKRPRHRHRRVAQVARCVKLPHSPEWRHLQLHGQD